MSVRVSVVIVNYRSRDALGGCLDSLRACARRVALEVIVVENASGDGTAAWVRQAYPEVVLIENEENLGFTRGVNQGLERARGELLLVLNPDCVMNVEALEELQRSLGDRPNCAAVAPMLVDGDQRVARSCGRFPGLWALFCDHFGLIQAFPDSPLFGHYKYGGHTMSSLGKVDWASGAALMIPRRIYEMVGGLDENIFMYMEEVDWCRRAARRGYHVRFVPTARIVHYGQQSSRQVPGETYMHNLRSRVYFFRKHHGALFAWLAKSVLLASLALKWTLTRFRRASRATAEVYAAALAVVWAA